MARVLDMSFKVLVGNAWGRRFNAKTLKERVASHWTGHLGYVSDVKILAGWVLYKLSKPEDALWALNKPWSMDSTPILFKLWTPLFDVGRKVWILYPFGFV